MIRDIRETVALHNGVEMPWFGLGTFKAEDGYEVEQAVAWALELGYRSIDTAAIYGNEVGVGRAIRNSGVPRKEIFLTTKVWNSEQGYDSTLRGFDASLARLELESVDLYLVHWPVKGQYKDTWRALERLYRDGRTRAIGVSNFLVHHLRDLLEGAEVVPMVNQYEFHPHLRQPELLDFCRQHKIQAEAWSPLMRGEIRDVAELAEIGRRHHKTPAQVVLRWDLQHGVVTIPKSTNRQRIAENAGIFDFELSADEMAMLDALDRGRRIGPDPDNFDF